VQTPSKQAHGFRSIPFAFKKTLLPHPVQSSQHRATSRRNKILITNKKPPEAV
jgi:hypothetical protein